MEACLSHISLIVKSEASEVFYSSLGFEETKRIIRHNDIVVLMESNGIGLELFVDSRHPERAIEPENFGVRYFALKVDDFDELINRLECGPINKDWYGKRYCFISDPDGLPVQLHE